MEALLRRSGRSRAELEISLVGRSRIRALNRDYRNKDATTDVLSFPLDITPPRGRAPWHLGEVVIATEVARRQAALAGRPLTRQVLRLAVHGFVHLHGLDHERGGNEARKFRRLEEKYLQHLAKKGLMPWDGCLRL
jgi:probable rRNA maturation factor